MNTNLNLWVFTLMVGISWAYLSQVLANMFQLTRGQNGGVMFVGMLLLLTIIFAPHVK